MKLITDDFNSDRRSDQTSRPLILLKTEKLNN